MKSKLIFHLNLLHILNDGFKASLLLFLPFIAKEFRMNLTDVGILGTSVNMMDIVLALPAGIIAMKFGGYRILLFALFIYACGYLFTSISPSYFWIIVSFIVAGIGFGLFHPISFSVVTHTSEKHTRGKTLGDFTAIGDIGRILISSCITFIIAYIGWRTSSFICFIMAFSFFGYFCYMFSHSSSDVQMNTGPHTHISFSELLNNWKFLCAIISFSLDSLASSAIFIFIPFLLLYRNVPEAYLGILTSVFFVGNMLGKSILGRFVDRYGHAKIFIISEIGMSVCCIVLAFSTTLSIILISSVILGIFTKGTVPVLATMLSRTVEHHASYERAFAINAFFTGIASTLAPTLLGYASQTKGITFAFLLSALCALLATLPAVILNFRKSI